MAAVNGDPLTRGHGRPHPEPEAHEVLDGRMERDGAMRLAPMQVQRDARGRDVRVHQGEDGVGPDGQLRPAARAR